VKIINLTRNTLLADEARIGNTFFMRLIGLLNRNSLRKGEALILTPSNCIHSFFMRFTIDVIFLDKTGKIIKTLPSFKPFRLSPLYLHSNLVIELPENTLKLSQTQPGDIIKILSLNGDSDYFRFSSVSLWAVGITFCQALLPASL